MDTRSETIIAVIERLKAAGACVTHEVIAAAIENYAAEDRAIAAAYVMYGGNPNG
jgi:hypothetical protein